MLKIRSIHTILTSSHFFTMMNYFKTWSYVSAIIEMHCKLYRKDEVLSQVYSELIHKNVALADADLRLLQAKIK